MLELVNITKRYRTGGTLFSPRHLTAVDDVSLRVERGSFFALVGESGCGKSTLARIMTGLESPTAGQLAIAGEVVASTASFRDKKLRRKVQMIFQDPYSSLNPRMRIRDILEEPLRSFGWGNASAIAERIAELRSFIRFPEETLERYPHQFSGGQRQRIAIARALAANPALLVCDEPVSALDVSVKGQIINLLIDIQERLGVTTIFISHDLSLVEKIADRVGVMYLGSLVEVGTARDVFNDPRHPYTQLLLDSVPLTDPSRRTRTLRAGEVPSPFAIPSGCRFRDRCPLAFARCAAEAPALAPATPGSEHLAACHLRGEPARRPAPPRRPAIAGIDLFRTPAIPPANSVTQETA